MNIYIYIYIYIYITNRIAEHLQLQKTGAYMQLHSVLYDARLLKPNACLYTLTITKKNKSEQIVNVCLCLLIPVGPDMTLRCRLDCRMLQITTQLGQDKEGNNGKRKMDRDFAAG